MQVRCNQNLGFGVLIIRVDKTKFNNNIPSNLLFDMTDKYINSKSPVRSHFMAIGKAIYMIDNFTNIESDITKNLRSLGKAVTVRRLTNPVNASKAYDQALNWFRK